MLRKITLLSSFLFLILFQVNAQLEIGILAGPGTSRLSIINKNENTRVDDHGFVFTQHLGAFINQRFKKRFQTEIELKYSRQGTKVLTKTAQDLVYRGHYLYMPLSVSYFPSRSTKIEVGTDLGITLKHPLHENDHLLDFGFHIGGVYYLGDKISAGFRYTHGISNVVYFEMRYDGVLIDELEYRSRLLELTIKFTLVTYNKNKED